MKFDFTDKASYLAWRQNWRENYRELSAEIRRLKRCRKQFLRTYAYSLNEGGDHPVRSLVAKLPNPEYGSTYKLSSLRLAAAYQMEFLAEAKALSWQMKKARVA